MRTLATFHRRPPSRPHPPKANVMPTLHRNICANQLFIDVFRRKIHVHAFIGQCHERASTSLNATANWFSVKVAKVKLSPFPPPFYLFIFSSPPPLPPLPRFDPSAISFITVLDNCTTGASFHYHWLLSRGVVNIYCVITARLSRIYCLVSTTCIIMCYIYIFLVEWVWVIGLMLLWLLFGAEDVRFRTSILSDGKWKLLFVIVVVAVVWILSVFCGWCTRNG